MRKLADGSGGCFVAVLGSISGEWDRSRLRFVALPIRFGLGAGVG